MKTGSFCKRYIFWTNWRRERASADGHRCISGLGKPGSVVVARGYLRTGLFHPDASVLDRPRGFSILEIVVAVAIMAVLGAIVLPSMGSYLDSKRVSDSAATLDSLRLSIGRFRTATTDYPGRLSHLTRRITTSDRSDCNTTANTIVYYAAGSVTGWTNFGPFWDRSIPTTGFVLPIGTVQDSMSRTSTSILPGTLVLTIPNVAIADARELNLLKDGPLDADQANGSNTTGTVQFTVPAATVTVTYLIPVANSC